MATDGGNAGRMPHQMPERVEEALAWAERLPRTQTASYIHVLAAALRGAQAENERLRAKIDYYENGLRTLYVGRPSDAALAPADEAKR